MSIDRVRIQNFQSIKNLDIELGNFTIIVGPSSSGKSAFVRALKALASNKRGHSFITTGEDTAVISADLGDKTVELHKSSKSDKTKYVVTEGDETKTFKKIGVSVPEEVSEALGIIPKDAINFAGQFDKPYLLDDSAAEVASKFGTLTNADIIFSAARESNRQKLSENQSLKSKDQELHNLIPRLQGFKTLKDRIAEASALEDLINEASALERKAVDLQKLIDTIKVSKSELDSPEFDKEIPDISDAIEAYEVYKSLKYAVQSTVEQAKADKAASLELSQIVSAFEEANQEYQDSLEALTQVFESLFTKISDDGKVVSITKASQLASKYVQRTLS